MNKSRDIFLIALAFLSSLLFVFGGVGIFAGLLVGLLIVGVAYLVFKDKALAAKTLQPYIVLCAVTLVRLVFEAIFAMILAFTNDSTVYSNTIQAASIVRGILMIVLICLQIVALVFICCKKDAPLVGTFANKIVSNPVESKTKKAKNKKNEPETDKTESEEK